ncbi:hypothetical protein O181_049052 [Austropuccinia psidii MF-1]|uniref:Uncharacterized protein n=1 Tax=Austropuccinia psidii MF-1 TaxID=1389203 RepID=A0A9Q3HM86_9BASI|nr:hypothetical protein [Austropuccinia psidii MF-1]
MPVHHSPPAKSTRSQRNQAVLTTTGRDPLDCTLSVHQLSENLDRGPPMEGEALPRSGGMKLRRSRSFYGMLGGYPGISQGPRRRLGEGEDEEGEECVEEQESEETEVEASLEGALEASKAPNIFSIKLNKIF